MQAGFTITLATAAHVVALPDIESRAAARFAGRHVPRAALAQTTPLETLAAAQAEGRLWAAVSRAGEPVGFGLVEPLGTRLHLEELDVLPDHGGLGIGTALMEAIEVWARANRFQEIALTTFRDIPWNAPFYQKLGYEIVEESDLDAVLLTWLQDEGARGLDPARRVAMRRRLGKDTEISIREAGTDDAATIATIHEAAVRGATVEACYGAAQIDAWAQPHAASQLAERIAARRFFIAVAQGRPIAYAQLDLEAATVRSVYVLPAFARRGVGRQLAQSMFQAAREAGLERLQLDSSLNAVPFYESLGFRRLEEIDHELRSGVVLRCVRMEKLLGHPMRIAYLADHPEAIAVLAEWFAAEWGDLGAQSSVEGYQARLPQRAARDRLPICILGLVDDTPVATATLKFREIEYSPDADFWLGSVYVREDRRGRGHGRGIVAAAEALAAARHLTPLYLYSPGKEALYLHLGWETVGPTVADGKPAAVMVKQPEGTPWTSP